jgi:hypothetical protein
MGLHSFAIDLKELKSSACEAHPGRISSNCEASARWCAEFCFSSSSRSSNRSLPQSACSSGKETENTGTGSATDTISSDIPSAAPYFFFVFRSSYLSLVFFPPILGLREEQE